MLLQLKAIFRQRLLIIKISAHQKVAVLTPLLIAIINMIILQTIFSSIEDEKVKK